MLHNFQQNMFMVVLLELRIEYKSFGQSDKTNNSQNKETFSQNSENLPTSSIMTYERSPKTPSASSPSFANCIYKEEISGLNRGTNSSLILQMLMTLPLPTQHHHPHHHHHHHSKSNATMPIAYVQCSCSVHHLD